MSWPGRSWRELTVEDIAAAVGLSRMTLHRHGTSEAALEQLRELLIAEHRNCSGGFSAPGSARDRMRLALLGVCDVDERYLALIDSLAQDLSEVFHEQGRDPS